MINKLIDNCECCHCKEKEEILKDLLNVNIPKYPIHAAVYLKKDFVKNKSRKDITTYYVSRYSSEKESYEISDDIISMFTRISEIKFIDNLVEGDLILQILPKFSKDDLVKLNINNYIWKIKEVIEENINVYKYKLIDNKYNTIILVDEEDIRKYKPVEEYVICESIDKKESILQKIFRILD